MARLHPGAAALLWVGVMFLPALPAYAWLWPAVRGSDWEHWVMVLVYPYFLAGTLAIGLPRWRLAELGVNRRGLWLSLACGAFFVLAVAVGLLGTNLRPSWRPPAPWQLAGDALFYFGQVGPVEELLFRGLIYRALLDWRGPRWAIWGSALSFGFYHVGRGGLFAALSISLVGLIWGLIRWRAGGIAGLVLVHAAVDTASRYLWLAPTLDDPLAGLQIVDRLYLLLGDALLLGLVLYLWRPGFLDARRRVLDRAK